MELTRKTGEVALAWALEQNPSPWGDHSRYVAKACENIAARCGGEYIPIKNRCRQAAIFLYNTSVMVPPPMTVSPS